MRAIIIAIAATTLTLLAGCQVNPATGRQELTESGKVLIQSTASIAMRRYLREHPERYGDIVANVRAVAVDLQSVTDVTTVSELRDRAEELVKARTRDPAHLADAQDLLDIFGALLKQQLGKDEIDGNALVQVNELADAIVRSLPPT